MMYLTSDDIAIARYFVIFFTFFVNFFTIYLCHSELLGFAFQIREYSSD